MGNAALLRPRPAVEERLTRPQRLVRQLSDLDTGRLRRLIRSGDLAPCFDADDDERAVECPICFYVRTRDRSLSASRLALLCCLLLMVFLSSMCSSIRASIDPSVAAKVSVPVSYDFLLISVEILLNFALKFRRRSS
jgi:hypothetical protein